MSYFAEINKNNIVVQVLVGNDNLPDEGFSFFTEQLGGTWVQTSFNATIRKKFAAIGDYYDAELDGFVPQSPYKSWIFDTNLWDWQAPVSVPDDKTPYSWDEESISWVVADFSEPDFELE